VRVNEGGDGGPSESSSTSSITRLPAEAERVCRNARGGLGRSSADELSSELPDSLSSIEASGTVDAYGRKIEYRRTMKINQCIPLANRLEVDLVDRC